MSALKRIGAYLSTHMAAATVVGNVLLTTALSGGVSYVVTNRLNEQQVVAAARIAEVGDFVKTAQEFDALTRAYMEKVAETEQVDGPSREALLANIQKQYVQLKTVKTYMPEGSRLVADNYQSNLVALSGEIQAADDILSTAPIWQSMGTTLKSKDTLISDLREAAKLPV